jgi:hypothetical protein
VVLGAERHHGGQHLIRIVSFVGQHFIYFTNYLQ